MACPAQSCDNFALPEVLCLGLQQARRIDRVQLTTGIPDTMLLLLLLLLLHALPPVREVSTTQGPNTSRLRAKQTSCAGISHPQILGPFRPGKLPRHPCSEGRLKTSDVARAQNSAEHVGRLLPSSLL